MQIKQSFWKAKNEASIASMKNVLILNFLGIITEFSF